MHFEKPYVEFVDISSDDVIATSDKCTDGSSGSIEYCSGPNSFSSGGCEDIAPAV